MSLLKFIKAQLGMSSTPANNFVLDASAQDGTMKLSRGNAGATTQDVLVVDASGNVLVGGNNLNLFSAKSLAEPGYQKLPSGLIIQWGVIPYLASSGAAGTTVSLPIAFPTAFLKALGADMGSGTHANGVAPAGLSQIRGWGRNSSGAYADTGINYLAIGY